MGLLLVAILVKAATGDPEYPWLAYGGTAIAVGLLFISGAIAQSIRLVAITSLYWLTLGLLLQPITRALSFAFDNDQWVLVILVLGAVGFAATRGVRFTSHAEVDP
jgi:ABC-type iron transport system FetAB permease component